MKIAYVLINANRREGTSRAIVEVAERLGCDHDVTVISRSNETLDLSRVQWARLLGPSWPDVAEFECFRVQTNRFLRHNQFDIVHSAGCNTIRADVYAIQTVHPKKMAVNESQNRDQSTTTIRRMTRQLYDSRVLQAERQAYRVRNRRGVIGYLPVSVGTQEELLSEYDVGESVMEVIPNGADLTKFNPARSSVARPKIRQELNVPAEATFFLFAGGEWRRKGLELAMQGMSMARDRASVLVVAGDDPDRNQYYALAKKLQIESQLRWIGFRKDIEDLYAAADAFIFPSSYEAFSLATIEAAATGLPVVMCDICGARDLIGNNECGFIIDRTPVALTNVLDLLASNKDLCNEMGMRGRARVERLFNWDSIASRTLNFYERLLSERARGRGH